MRHFGGILLMLVGVPMVLSVLLIGLLGSCAAMFWLIYWLWARAMEFGLPYIVGLPITIVVGVFWLFGLCCVIERPWKSTGGHYDY